MAQWRVFAMAAAVLALAGCTTLPTMVSGPNRDRMPKDAPVQPPVVVAAPKPGEQPDDQRFATAKDVQDRIDAITRAINGLPAEGESGARNVVAAIEALTAEYRTYSERLAGQSTYERWRADAHNAWLREKLDELIRRLAATPRATGGQSQPGLAELTSAIKDLATAIKGQVDPRTMRDIDTRLGRVEGKVEVLTQRTGQPPNVIPLTKDELREELKTLAEGIRAAIADMASGEPGISFAPGDSTRSFRMSNAAVWAVMLGILGIVGAFGLVLWKALDGLDKLQGADKIKLIEMVIGAFAVPTAAVATTVGGGALLWMNRAQQDFYEALWSAWQLAISLLTNVLLVFVVVAVVFVGVAIVFGLVRKLGGFGPPPKGSNGGEPPGKSSGRTTTMLALAALAVGVLGCLVALGAFDGKAAPPVGHPPLVSERVIDRTVQSETVVERRVTTQQRVEGSPEQSIFATVLAWIAAHVVWILAGLALAAIVVVVRWGFCRWRERKELLDALEVLSKRLSAKIDSTQEAGKDGLFAALRYDVTFEGRAVEDMSAFAVLSCSGRAMRRKWEKLRILEDRLFRIECGV